MIDSSAPNSQLKVDSMSSQVAAGVRWNLTDALPARSGKIFQADILDPLEGLVTELENMRPELTMKISGERFMQLLGDYERIVRIRARLGSYAYMYFSEDTRSQDARTFKGRAEEIDADTANRTLFFELWFKSLDTDDSAKLIEKSGNYSYYLRRLVQTKPFTLTEPVEQAINLKDTTGRSALLQLYHQIRDSFVYDVEIGDKVERLTEERLRDLFYSPIRSDRASAYSSMLGRFEQNKDTIGEIYKTLVRDWRNEGIKLRKYSSPISVRNVANDVPDEAVSALLNACKNNSELFRRYFTFKARILGISDFSRFDIYAPLPFEVEKTYSWKDGRDLVLNTFRSFDPTFSSLAERLFAEHHIDAEPREGKIGGAYCMSVTPDITPFVLLSYTGKPKSIATLAHELGHGVHSLLSAKKGNNELVYEAPLPLAETASVFAELLLTDQLLVDADQNTRASLLAGLIDDSYGTIIRQAFFVLFELSAHDKIAAGINVDELCEVYLENLKHQFGDSVRIPEYFRFEWLSIPHIFQTPFYCYSYSWGNLLVLALYSQFKKEGPKDFAPRYRRILEYGGSEAPERILLESGFDIRSEKFWQNGFDEIFRIVSELEKI
jgi:oligoendopeptidase F